MFIKLYPRETQQGRDLDAIKTKANSRAILCNPESKLSLKYITIDSLT